MGSIGLNRVGLVKPDRGNKIRLQIQAGIRGLQTENKLDKVNSSLVIGIFCTWYH